MAEETKIIRLVIDSSRAVDGERAATRALENIERQSGQAAASVKRMEEGFGSAANALKGFVALLALDRINAMWQGVVRAGAAIDDFAERIGESTKFIQGSQFAAASHTVALEKLDTAYTKASQTIGNAAEGQKDAIELFDRLGVKVLDAGGRLRSTSAILQESAVGLLRIEDPARRVAAAMDLFGKSGAAMIPMLSDIAAGADYMAAKAARAGAMMDEDVVKALAAMQAKSEEAGLKWTALVATLGTPIATAALDGFNKSLGETLRLIQQANGSFSEFLRLALNESRRTGRIGTGPNQLRLMTPEERREWDREQLLKERSGGSPAVEGRETYIDEDLARLNADQRASILASQAGYQDDEDWARRFKMSPSAPAGARNPTVKGAGQSEAQRYDKLVAQLDAAATAQDKLTAAADRGDVAFQKQTVHAEALQKAIEIYGQALADTDPRLQKIEELMTRIAEGKAAQAFAQGTTALRGENELLEAQIRLMGQAPEIQAREIALIKAKQEAQKAGIDQDSDRYKARVAELELNEKLKVQAEQMKQANELWTEPLKQALRDIQSTGANMWESILETGKFSAESLGQLFAKTARRIAAEFLALATVRPVMSVMVQGLGGLGIVSPATASQLGYPLGGSGGLGGLGGGGFSLPQMPGGASGGGFLGNVGGWLNTPLGGIDSEIAAWSQYGTAAQGSFSLGNITPLGAIGGLASIGMGAYSLFSGNGSTGSVIGGLSGILGGGMGLLAAAMPALSALGPIGMGIGLVGGLLGGLLGGGGEPPIPAQPALNLNIGSFMPTAKGGFSSSGYGLNGGGSLADAAGGLGTTVSKLFRTAGLTTVPGQMWGGQIWSGTDHVLNGRQWNDRPYTQGAIVGPQGQLEYTNYNDSSRNLQQTAEMVVAAVFKSNLFRGGVTGGSESLKAGIDKYNVQSVDEITKVIALSQAYDKLGKAANPVKDAIDKLSSSFDELRGFAEKASLSMEPINAELEKQTKRTAQDFIDSMLDPLAVQMRALDDERKTALESAQYIKDHIEGVYVDMDRIATYYTNKEAQLRDQFYGNAVASLQSIINRLTPGGDLANLDPSGTLSGLKATYDATLAQARANDPTAVANFGSVASNYAEYSYRYFAGSPEYEAIRQQILAAAQELQAAIQIPTGNNGAPLDTNNPALSSLVSQVQQLLGVVKDQQERAAQQSAEITRLTNLLSRYITNQAQAA